MNVDPLVAHATVAGDVLAILTELQAIAGRRGSLPEFRDRLLEIVEGLPDAFEALRVDPENGAALTGDITLALQFREPFLKRVAALRALDRDFELAGRVHGASV